MSRKIFKYVAPPGPTKFTFNLPCVHVVRKVLMVDGRFTFWIEVEPDSTTVAVDFEIVGTGWLHEFDRPMKYIDTIMDGRLVWHVYVEKTLR